MNRSASIASAAEPEALTSRVAALAGGESQLVLQYLAGLSPGTVDTVIDLIKALQFHQAPQ